MSTIDFTKKYTFTDGEKKGGAERKRKNTKDGVDI